MFSTIQKSNIIYLLRYIIVLDECDLASCHKSVYKYSNDLGLNSEVLNKPLKSVNISDLKNVINNLSEIQKDYCFDLVFEMLYSAGIEEWEQYHPASLWFNNFVGIDSHLFMYV